MSRVISKEDVKTLLYRLKEQIDEYGELAHLGEYEIQELYTIAEGFTKYYISSMTENITDIDIFDKYLDSLELVYGSHKYFDRLPLIRQYYKEAEEVEQEQRKELNTEKKLYSKPQQKPQSSFNSYVSTVRNTSRYSNNDTCGGGSSSGSRRSSC